MQRNENKTLKNKNQTQQVFDVVVVGFFLLLLKLATNKTMNASLAPLESYLDKTTKRQLKLANFTSTNNYAIQWRVPAAS